MCDQTEVLAVLGADPMTQKEIIAKLGPACGGKVSHPLNLLLKKGLVKREILDRRYRPFGYKKI